MLQKKAKPNWQDPHLIERAAIGLLARREHSRYELQQKLSRKGIAVAQLNKVLDKLAAQSWLSDARFAEVYTHHRATQGYGPLRIRQELITRGVDKSIIEPILAELSTRWMVLAAKLRFKKFGSVLPQDLTTQAKQTQFLLYRGFSFEHIRWDNIEFTHHS